MAAKMEHNIISLLRVAVFIIRLSPNLFFVSGYEVVKVQKTLLLMRPNSLVARIEIFI